MRPLPFAQILFGRRRGLSRETAVVQSAGGLGPQSTVRTGMFDLRRGLYFQFCVVRRTQYVFRSHMRRTEHTVREHRENRTYVRAKRFEILSEPKNQLVQLEKIGFTMMCVFDFFFCFPSCTDFQAYRLF